MTEETLFSEARLADWLGIRREYLREARVKLKEGEECLQKDGAAMLTEKGVRAMLEALDVKLAKKGRGRQTGTLTIEDALAFASVGAMEPEKTRRLRVDGLSRNRIIVWGVLAPEEPPHEFAVDRLRVRVRDSREVREGTDLLCRHVEQDLWEHVG